MNDATNASTCDPARLVDYLKDRLSNDDEVALTEHLNQCAVCRNELAIAAASKEIWTDAADFLKADADELGRVLGLGAGHDQDRFERNTHQIQQVLDILAPTDDPQSLGRLGPYEVTGVVGSGGMGVVLKATEKSLDRTVAIKVLAPHLGANGAA